MVVSQKTQALLRPASKPRVAAAEGSNKVFPAMGVFRSFIQGLGFRALGLGFGCRFGV